MRRQRKGRIINLSSVHGFIPASCFALYAATKHAVEGYSQSLDHELCTLGIRVTLVKPPPMLMQMMSNGDIGGGVASAVAQALGANRNADADALVWRAIVLACAFGLIFTKAAIIGGPTFYRPMGGTGPTLTAALTL